jgi:hypothetical protein
LTVHIGAHTHILVEYQFSAAWVWQSRGGNATNDMYNVECR